MRNITSLPGTQPGGRTITSIVYAELPRGDSVVEKQVKEARSKCRSIASLLTDAPDPHSKGVLMFKKRRQRAKKYTLTCFGRAEGETGGETEGETGGEEEEGSSFPSGSEVDEEGFSGTYDPTWDSGYLDMLDRRSSACPSTTPTNHSPGLENSAYQSLGLENSNYHSPGLENSTYQSPGINNSTYQSPGQNNSTYDSPGLNNSAYQSPGLDESKKQPVRPSPTSNPSPQSPPDVSLANGVPLGVSRTSMVLIPHPSDPNPYPNINPDPNPNITLNPNPGGVLNRTARPFTPGLPPPRTPATPVCFRPPQPAPLTKSKPVSMVTKPTSAISMVTIPAPRSAPGPEVRRAVSSTSLYISPRPNTSVLSPPPLLSPPSLAPTSLPSGSSTPFSPPSSVLAAPFSPHPMPLSPPLCPPPVCLSSTVICHPSSPPSVPPVPVSSSACPLSPPHQPAPVQYSQRPPAPVQYPQPPPPGPAHLPPPPTFNPYMSAPGGPAPPAHMISPPLPPSFDSLESREQRISVPASRTGILQDARRRSNKKPMFSAVEEKKAVSPNPALLSLLQNLSLQPEASPEAGGPGGTAMEAGTESGPEEDWLKLGAEACNFLQAQRGHKPPPVAPKPHVQQQVPQLGGKGGQLFARRQSRMDRFVVEHTPGTPRPSPASPREPSPTPSLPATWKYSSSIRAPPPINYNPLLSPSCPTQAQKPKGAEKRQGTKKAGIKAVDIMSHQPYQLNSSLFSYGGPQKQSGSGGGPQAPMKTARVQEIRRFSTPPPSGPVLKIIAPRSATTLGEPFWRSDVISPPPTAAPVPYQPYQPKPASSPYQSQVQPANSPYMPQVQPASSPYQPQPGSTPYLPQTQPASTPYQLQHASTSYLPQTQPASSPYQPQPASTPYQPQVQPASSPYLLQVQPASSPYQPQVHKASLHLSPPPPPTAPLPPLPIFSPGHAPNPLPPPAACGSPSSTSQATWQSKSAPDLSPLSLACSRPPSSAAQPASGPRPRFSTSTLGLQPHIWRPGSTLY